MAEQESGGGTGDADSASLTAHPVIAGLEALYNRYHSTMGFLGNYSPYAVRGLELVMAMLLFFGFVYWLYLYFIVGT